MVEQVSSNFSCEHTAQVTVTDLKSHDQLKVSLSQLDGLPVTWKLGSHDELDFQSHDILITNPAIKPGNKYVNIAQSNKLEITTEIELFLHHCKAKIIAVTGSAGKSTTATLIYHLLKACGHKAWLGGNIGVSLLPCLSQITAEDWVVLELSSFQLAQLSGIKFAPEVAVITSFFANHLDWHGNVEEYQAAKQKLLNHQSSSDYFVTTSELYFQGGNSFYSPAELRLVHPQEAEVTQGQYLGDRFGVLPLGDWLKSNSRHTIQNAELAVIAASLATPQLTTPIIKETLREFKGLPHRLEYLGAIEGVEFWNDSKATTPESTIASLQAFAQPLVLLAGGADKGVPMTTMLEAIKQRAKCVVWMGELGETLHHQFHYTNCGVESYCAQDAEDAFRTAFDRALPGDVVLLAPGCAAFGWFKHYHERGEKFREYYVRLKSKLDYGP